MNGWQARKAKFGPIRKNQLWYEPVTRTHFVIQRKNPGNSWRCVRYGSGAKQTHVMKERDLYKSYELVR